jgi:hypothetical protein
VNTKSNNLAGIAGSIFISFILLFIFYGNILKSPNSIYFSASGDGLKSTFGSVYHLNHDTSYLRTNYMNYPFGESVFYTGGQPVITNSFKFLKNIGIDFSDNLLGFINIWMLFSIVLGALFLYLILRELKLPILYSIAVSNIIAFMSPQLGRFGGHFNLAYLYFIPLMIYLFLVFYRTRKFYISLLLGFVALLSLLTHAYFFGFHAFLVIVFWIGVIIVDKESFGKLKFFALNICVQFILPFVIFQILVWSSGEVGDRTSYPWGFFSFPAYLQGIFYPINRVYGRFLHVKQVPWEGISYIGLVGVAGFLIIIFHRIKCIRERKGKWSFLKISDNTFLNTLFWASILALVFSFGIPFSLGLKKLFNYMGLIKQLRAPGRFAWLFFYSINIVTFYLLWQYFSKTKKIFATILLSFALLWGSYDAYLNVSVQEKYINNTIPSLYDKENSKEINRWYTQIDFSNFQAIIPLPYFHIGSENYWIEGSGESKKQSFIASMKTGLPLTSVMMGRTSMDQTIKNLQLIMEPYNSFDVIDLWPNEKPFLIILDKNGNLSFPEKKIRNKARLLTFNDLLEIRSITKNDFEEILQGNKENIKMEFDSLKLFKRNQFLSTDSVTDIYYEGFGNVSPSESEIGTRCYSGNIKKENIIFEKQFMAIDTSKEYVISLWVQNMNKDMYPRTKLTASFYNESGDLYSNDNFDIWRRAKIIAPNGWGLIEFNVKFKSPNDKIELSMINNLLTHGELLIDEVLMRPVGVDVYAKFKGFIYKNNRFYSFKN